MLDAGCWTLDDERLTLDLDDGRRTLGAGRWTLACWTLDAGTVAHLLYSSSHRPVAHFVIYSFTVLLLIFRFVVSPLLRDHYQSST
jgi:hypothetical protein